MAKVNIFDIFNQETEMVCDLRGQKIYVYGDSDCGKTFQATRMEKPFLIMTEPGGNARKCPKKFVDSWDTFTDIVSQLTSKYEEASQYAQTLIIDTVEELVALVENKVAKRYGVLEVGMVQGADKKNPNGYSLARNMFRQQINLLTGYGYTVVFLGHQTEIEYDDPDTGETYKKIVPYNSDKEKGSTRFVRNLCDFVIYVKSQGVNKETGETIYSKAFCKETKHIFCRSRYAMQSEIQTFTAENLKEAIEKAIKKTAENEGAGLTEFKMDLTGYTKEDYFDMILPYMTKLYDLYPDYVMGLLEEQLGSGRKLRDATDEEITELGNIYSELVSYSCDRGIVIEE